MAKTVAAAVSPTNGAGVARRSLTVLGATGSIGKSTLDLVQPQPRGLRGRRADRAKQCRGAGGGGARHPRALAVIGDPALFEELRSALAGTGIEAAAGPAAVIAAAARARRLRHGGHRRRRRARADLRGGRQGRRVALGQQGMPRLRRRRVHGRRARGRHRAAARRQRALRLLPGAGRGGAREHRAHRPHRFGRAVPHLEPGAAARGDAGAGAAPSQLVDGRARSPSTPPP